MAAVRLIKRAGCRVKNHEERRSSGHGLLQMAVPADKAAPAAAVVAANFDHDATGGRTADILVNVMAGGAVHLVVVAEQSLVEGLARQAGTRPGGRHRGRGARRRRWSPSR